MNNEVGRELKALELKPKTVVVISVPGMNTMVTMWVGHINEQMVEFYSGDLRLSVINFISPEGVITDDRGQVVKVYEYLGEV